MFPHLSADLNNPRPYQKGKTWALHLSYLSHKVISHMRVHLHTDMMKRGSCMLGSAGQGDPQQSGGVAGGLMEGYIRGWSHITLSVSFCWRTELEKLDIHTHTHTAAMAGESSCEWEPHDWVSRGPGLSYKQGLVQWLLHLFKYFTKQENCLCIYIK